MKDCFGSKEYSKDSPICKVCMVMNRCGKIKDKKRRLYRKINKTGAAKR